MTPGAVNAIDTPPLPGTAAVIDGAPGTVRGVTPSGASAAEAAPTMASLTARTRTRYDRPFSRPVITSGLAVDAGVRALHDTPPSTEYS